MLAFFHIDSKPDEDGQRRGIEELKKAIGAVAITLPEVGRSVPERWQAIRKALIKTGEAYMLLDRVYELCREHQMEEDETDLFISIEHRLGHLIHYEHDPDLRNIVILKPDWLATAISFVLDDKETLRNGGLVSLSRLSQLWDNPEREPEYRYSANLHRIFLRTNGAL